MALGGIAGTDPSTLLNSLGKGAAAGRGARMNVDAPKGKDSRAERAGAVKEASPREQVRAMQVRLLLEATIRVAKQVKGSGGGGEESNLAAQLAEIMAGHAEAFQPDEGGVRPIDRLAEMFTPEATAERIFDFATSWYGQWLDGREDNGENRAEFAEYIGAAVEKGFREAQSILGALPGEVQGNIDRTHELVFNAFDNFVENGLSKNPGELAAARGAGLTFNYTFGGLSSDPAALLDEVLDRLNADGTLRLDSIPITHAPGELLDLVA